MTLARITRKKLSVTHIWWADNFWLFAENHKELTIMLQEATEALEKLGMRWKPASMEYLYNDHVPEKDRQLPVTVAEK